MSPETLQLLDLIVGWSGSIFFTGIVVYMWFFLRRIQQRDSADMDESEQKKLTSAITLTGPLAWSLIVLVILSQNSESALDRVSLPILFCSVWLGFSFNFKQTEHISARLSKIVLICIVFFLLYDALFHFAEIKQSWIDMLNLFQPI